MNEDKNVDWKENTEFVLNTGEVINVNIFVLVLIIFT